MACLAALAVLGAAAGAAASRRGGAAARPAAAAPPPPPSFARTLATVWAQPTGLATSTPCDAAAPFDMCTAACCNSWWLRDDAWAVYEAARAKMWPLLRWGLGGGDDTALMLYFPAFLADASLAGAALARLATVVADCAALGGPAKVILLVGRPDFYGPRGLARHDPVNNATARAHLTAALAAILAVPALRPPAVEWASVYWMGAACHAAAACSEAAVGDFTAALRAAVRAATGGALAYAQHIDGTFWDACWPQPCATWNYGGYSPRSLNNSADGIIAESWVQGSLAGGVRALLAGGVVTASTLLLVDDVPNCDLEPSHPCSTGSLAGDVAAWGATLADVGLQGTWAVWNSVDAGAADANFYGDVDRGGANLTAKGLLHRARALAGG